MDISNFVGFANDLEDRGAVGGAGFDSNSLWAITTPAGLRRFATCPNSAVGVICEPGALRSNPPFRRLNKKGHLFIDGLFYLIGRDGTARIKQLSCC